MILTDIEVQAWCKAYGVISRAGPLRADAISAQTYSYYRMLDAQSLFEAVRLSFDTALSIHSLGVLVAWIKCCEEYAMHSGTRYLECLVDEQSFLLLRRDINVWDYGRDFKSDDELSYAKEFDFKFHWFAQDRLEGYQAQVIRKPMFVNKRKGGMLRIGIATHLFQQELEVHCPYPSRPKLARVSLKNEAVTKDRLVEVVNAAAQSNVEILLFPELSLTPSILDALQALLRAGTNGPKLVVAGSMHVDALDSERVDSFANRAYVLSEFGQILYVQDKINLFHLDNGTHEPGTSESLIRLLDLGGFRVATPICIDFFSEKPWPPLLKLASLHLVPAMSKNLARFIETAKRCSGHNRAITAVANAHPYKYEENQGFLVYLPIRENNGPAKTQSDLHPSSCNYLCYFDMKMQAKVL